MNIENKKNFFSAEKQIKLAQDLFQEQLSNAFVVDNPVWQLMGGQPGSGKTTLKKQLVEKWSNKGGVIQVDPDFIRLKMATIQKLIVENALFEHTQLIPESGSVAHLVESLAKTSKRNVLVDRVLRDSDRAIRFSNELKETGFKVEVHGMLVHPDLSLARIFLRYEEELVLSNFKVGRKVNNEFYYKALSGWLNTLKKVYNKKCVDKMYLYDFSGKNILKLNFNKKRSYAFKYSDPQKLINYYAKPDKYTMNEIKNTWEKVFQYIKNRSASKKEMEEVLCIVRNQKKQENGVEFNLR